MKNLKFLFILSFIFFAGQAMAQFQEKGVSELDKKARITEQVRTMSMGSESALVLSIADADEKLVEEVWKNYIKDFYRGKTKKMRREGEWFTDDASITAIGGSNTVDLYAVIDQAGKDVDFLLWCDLGGAFLSSDSHPERYREAEALLQKFNLEVTKAKIQQELDEEEKELKKLENELKKLENDNERAHKEIEKAREAIAKAEKEIEQNLKDQEASAQKIEGQKEVIEAVRKKLNKIK